MATSFRTRVLALKSLLPQNDAESNGRKLAELQGISNCELPTGPSLVAYADTLLFLLAFPPDVKVQRAATKEMQRIARSLGSKKRTGAALLNSGLPYTSYEPKFSHDLCTWLSRDTGCHVRLGRFEDAEFELDRVLAITLPSLERSETTAGVGNMELLRALGVPSGQELLFLLAELKKLDDRPRIKDLLFDALGVRLRVDPRNRSFSRMFNRIPAPRSFHLGRNLNEFDRHELIGRALPLARTMAKKAKEQVVRAIKLSMVLSDRETDPVTYMDERTLRVFDLEHGTTVAIYGMHSARQLPLESYIGYTLFMNGYPTAYGGAWVFGRRADFGINIFEAFRGGGSGYMLCQLLRVYHEVFRIEHFEIEPYQFGLDNPDGITTGAFWFYHRYGFRPVDRELRELAELEVKKKAVRNDYRTGSRTLLKFTASNLALTLTPGEQAGVYDIADKVKHLIRRRYKGDRTRAEADSVKLFLGRTGGRMASGGEAMAVLKEVALWAEAWEQRDPNKLEVLSNMVRTKPVDPYAYQELVLRYFGPR